MEVPSLIIFILLLIIENFAQDINILQNEIADNNVAEATTDISKNTTTIEESIAVTTLGNTDLETIQSVIELLQNNEIRRGSVAENTIQNSEVDFGKHVDRKVDVEKNNNKIEETIGESFSRNTTIVGESNKTEIIFKLDDATKIVATDDFVEIKELPSYTNSENTTTDVVELGIPNEATTKAPDESTTLSLKNLEIKSASREEIKLTGNDSLKSIESVSSELATTTTEMVLTKKPSLPLEDYAVQQMNFILDHLLIETQKFVAKVLQATVYTLFERDYLKRYAESLNLYLSFDNDSDYADETTEASKNMTQEELYRGIIIKLNFLNSKRSKNLHRHLPQNWLHEYRSQRLDMTIWLDKAAEEMQLKFQHYVREEEDRIKHQYFSEAFDDILRATEIQHKLALLADLVKIVKNKKQITFLDLYMQTS